MNSIIIPKDYRSSLDLYETQKAIALTKRIFQDNLIGMLGLQRVSAPLMVIESSGLNDGLNGVERPVSFDIPAVGGTASIVHSLAKWKRMALGKYGFSTGRGLYTDMNAIRRDEESLDNIHSVYVDQWDWEKIISEDERNEKYLRKTVKTIVNCICDTQEALMNIYPSLSHKLERDVYFISSEELLRKYPGRSPKERELLVCREYGTVFISQIGCKLSDGTVLYTSPLLKPGQGLDEIPLNQTLSKGTYDAMVYYQCVLLDEEQTPLNAAESAFTLIVN